MERLPRTFLQQDGAACAPEQARVVLVPVPYDGTTTGRPGARFGPEAILAASAQLEEYDWELDLEPIRVGVHVDEPVAPSAAGPEHVVAAVRQVVGGWLEKGRFPIVLGGEHTVAVGAGWAATDHFGEVTFLQIDAHLDCRDSYQGSRFSHACTARRLWERGKVVSVGIRSACGEDMEWVRAQEARVFWARDLAVQPTEEWIPGILEALGETVYVTLDVDGLDPSVIPATGTPEPGGLGYWEVLALLREVGRYRRVVGCDLCELAPAPGQWASEVAAANLVYKMVGYFVASPQRTTQGADRPGPFRG